MFVTVELYSNSYVLLYPRKIRWSVFLDTKDIVKVTYLLLGCRIGEQGSSQFLVEY